jgi:hypothetical protein
LVGARADADSSRVPTATPCEGTTPGTKNTAAQRGPLGCDMMLFMSWQRRLMLGLAVFIGVAWLGDRFQQRYDRWSLAAQNAASDEGRRLGEATDAAVDVLKDFQLVAGSKWTSEQVEESNRLLAKVNRLNSEQIAVWRRIAALQQPWRYRSAWNVATIATLTLGGGWSIQGALHERRAARRRSAGQCVLCGYDLRASPDRFSGVRRPNSQLGLA